MFEWALNNIRIEKIILAPIWATFFFFVFFFVEVSALLDVDIVTSYNLVQYQENIMMKMAKNIISDPVWVPRNFFHGFYLYC